MVSDGGGRAGCNGAHGSNHTGLVQYTAGKVGLAAWFDGQSCLRLPHPRLLDGASNATISAWIFFSTPWGGQIIATGDNRMGLDPISTRINPAGAEDLTFAQVSNGGQINMALGGQALPGLSVGVWRLFTLVLERQPGQSVLRCYADATLVKQTASAEFSRISYDADMFPLVGAIDLAGPWQHWIGGIDELRIYNRALSGAEVAELFYGGPDPRLTIEVSHVRLCWNASTSRTYQLQYRSELTTNQWADLGVPIPGNGGISCATDAILSPRRFYRVVTWP